ncbi:hypothetical protein K466DRAFT_626666 [Polyporus arcularius HHB13444]|uniref:Uncharacterized protein n=1 Tax=Polyporus arcularius HHB13444 TaxID=1314778 RepID=A0A5C3P3I9_9APHY|nr:hypothetical protein K466DRAFT_626666 [Polyporus arcularius HHB13444]
MEDTEVTGTLYCQLVIVLDLVPNHVPRDPDRRVFNPLASPTKFFSAFFVPLNQDSMSMSLPSYGVRVTHGSKAFGRRKLSPSSARRGSPPLPSCCMPISFSAAWARYARLPPRCADVIREDFESLLRACTRLRSFSLHTHQMFRFALGPCEDDTDQSEVGFNPMWLLDLDPAALGGSLVERLASGLTTLDLALPLAELDAYHTMLMLTHATHLTSLSLGDVDMLPSGLSCPTIHFPALTTLQIRLDKHGFEEYITEQWRMPKLTALTCFWSREVPMLLLGVHGARLAYLHLYDDPGREPDDGPTLLRLLRELCPVIEHLVLAIAPPSLSELGVISLTLRYLDIIHARYPTVTAYKAIALSEDADAPCLQSIRFVQESVSVDSDVEPDSHSLSHAAGAPKLVTSGGIAYVFPYTRMRQQSWVVADEPVPPEEDNSDDEYFPPGWFDEDASEDGEGAEADRGAWEEEGRYIRNVRERLGGLEGDFLLDGDCNEES